MTTSNPNRGEHLDGERTDILAGLASARHFLRFTVRDLTDEQARQRTTASELSLGGLIKHVAATEQGWATFVLEGPSALGDVNDMTDADMARWTDAVQLLPDETLAGVLADYEKVAQLVGPLADRHTGRLNARHSQRPNTRLSFRHNQISYSHYYLK